MGLPAEPFCMGTLYIKDLLNKEVLLNCQKHSYRL